MFEEVRKNKIKSWILVIVFTAIIVNLGAVVGFIYGNLFFGIILALMISVIFVFFGYFSGDKTILKISGAREVTKKEYPYLFHLIDGLAVSAGISKPRAYVIDDSALNAFATGRNPKHASITVTTGLLKKMNRQELEGVVAHEMSHIKNYDVRFMMLVVMLAGLITLLSDFMFRSFFWSNKGKSSDKKGGNVFAVLIIVAIVLAILSPIIGQIIRFSISRKREFLADANAAVLTRYPPGLASALKKIAKDPDPLVDKANKATAHLFISTPFRKEHGISRFFLTHPSLEERIKRLEEM